MWLAFYIFEVHIPVIWAQNVADLLLINKGPKAIGIIYSPFDVYVTVIAFFYFILQKVNPELVKIQIYLDNPPT